ncbi:acyltransferase family protein [Ferruginibacter sp. SUN106]|uniref:acyltransferase family protein n=1 Tax=Ferruginibacter sp. SUN106 TaxID=2978348 RepID=UPI003D35B668
MLPALKPAKERFPALTGIRTMGAAAVFFLHLSFKIGFNISVDVMALFFVLSGFLIFYIYYENAAVKKWQLRQYFINRFARIYPVYFLLVTVAILLRHDFRPLFLFKNYTLTHALFHHFSDIAIQPSWSITVEECFYFLAPLFMYLVTRFSFYLALLSGALLLVAALFISTLPLSFLHTSRLVFSTTFFGHFFEFFCGIFLALVILKREKKGVIALQGIKYTIGGLAGIAMAIGITELTKNMNDPGQATQFFLINNFILPIPVAVLYYGLMCEKSGLATFLSFKWLGLLGRTSYAFYLVHTIVIESIAVPFIQPYFSGYHNLYVITVFVLAQIIAFCIYVFYEVPLNTFIRKKFSSARVVV